MAHKYLAAALGLQPGFVTEDLGHERELETEGRVGRNVHEGMG